GIEKMKILSFSSLISKTVSIFGLFYFVNEPSDYILIPIISCLGIFFSLLISYFYLFKKVKIFFIMPDIKGLIKSVQEGKEMFFSIISSSLYTSSNVVLIGIFAGQEKAAFYSCAEKIIKSFLGLFSPLFQSLYPYMVEKINFNPKECVQNLKKYLPIFFTFSFSCSALIFIFSSDIINLLFGWEYMASVKALKIMSFIIFLVSVSNILGTQIMIPLNFKKEFLFIISSAGLFAVTGMLATSAKYHVEGAALIFLLSEIYVSCAMIFFIIKKKILFWI
ncbi:MAG: oligosaccharide flippase family protein, partial [Elusimicrobia bacterium]|nr:oligosaccharide flippase family protein [Elusimicrobiota bacterium]